MKISTPEVLSALLLVVLVLIPSGTQPDVPDDPEPVVPAGDILDQAEDDIRDALVGLLGVYADEDLTDSKFFDAFSEELSREQAKAMMPISQAIYKSEDLRATAGQLANHTLGVE